MFHVEQSLRMTIRREKWYSLEQRFLISCKCMGKGHMNEREEMIREKIETEELIEGAQLKGIREEIHEILIRKKGFGQGEIEIDPAFRIKVANSDANVTVDFAIKLTSEYLMVIKCVSTGIESWERYVLSFARAAEDYQIPYAAVTDGISIKLFDAISGSLLSESLDDFFDRKKLTELISDFKKIRRSEKNLDRERRIIYAFENIKCPPSKSR